MYVTVKYYRSEMNGYAGKEYCYWTDLDVRRGDVVAAPVRGIDQRAVVVGIKKPKPEFQCSEITKMWEVDFDERGRA